jgi:hypothetical protein
MFVLQGDTRVADIFLTEFMRQFNQCTKPRPVCGQSHGRKCESGSRRRLEPASAGSNVDCHDIHAIAAELTASGVNSRSQVLRVGMAAMR